MTTDNLGKVQNIGSVAASMGTLNLLKNKTLFARINWIFGLYVGGLAAGICYGLYNLYSAYQFKYHNSFGLDDRCKLVKCKALLQEAHPLVRECEDLLASITDRKRDAEKQELFLMLVQHYANIGDLDRAYQTIEHRLGSPVLPATLLKAVQSVQERPDSDLTRLSDSLSRIFGLKKQSSVEGWLKFAKAFHSLNNSALAERSLNEAVLIVSKTEKYSDRFVRFCRIAQCCHETDNLTRMDSSIRSAQELLNDGKIEGARLISAHLTLADTFFSIGKFQEMDQELGQVLGLKSLLGLASLNCHSFTKLIKDIAKNDKITESRFKNFDVGPFIKDFLTILENSSDKLTAQEQAEQAGVYLDIARIYQEKLLDDIDTQKKVMSKAFEKTSALPQCTNEERDFKIEFLGWFVRLHHEQDAEVTQKAMELLEGLYDQYPSVTDGPLWGKSKLGRCILELYKRTQLESGNFFEKYVEDFLSHFKTPLDAINNLVACVSAGNGTFLDQEEMQRILEPAEKVASELTSSTEYEEVLGMLARGYLQVNRQKSLQLLEGYKNRQAKGCLNTASAVGIGLITASAAAVAVGALCFYGCFKEVPSLFSRVAVSQA